MKSGLSALSQINVTSLVDTTMALLIIFMITVPVLREWVEVELPKTEAEQVDLQEGLVIHITRDKVVYLDKEKVALEEFDRRFSEAWAKAGRKAVFLRADSEIPYGFVVDVVGRVKALGGEHLGLVVESKEKR